MLHKIKSTLEKLDPKKEDSKKGRPPPEDEFALINWVDGFLPAEHRATVNARFRHMLLSGRSVGASEDVSELSSGHVVVSREFREKRFRQHRHSLGEKSKHLDPSRRDFVISPSPKIPHIGIILIMG